MIPNEISQELRKNSGNLRITIWDLRFGIYEFKKKPEFSIENSGFLLITWLL